MRRKESDRTIIYGASDDLIEVDGGKAGGEVNCYGTDESERGVLMVCSDGTMLEVKYGKGGQGIWSVTLIKKGTAFVGIEQCDSEDASPHSDVASFSEPLAWCYAATTWEKVS